MQLRPREREHAIVLVQNMPHWGQGKSLFSRRYVVDAVLTAGLLIVLVPSLCAAGNASVACGSSRPDILTDYSGSFTSANYPNYYASNANCQWRIMSGELNGWVKLDFVYFQTEYNRDIVTAYDGSSSSASRIVSVSGVFSNPPRGITSKQRYMFVTFTSDPSLVYRGFEAVYMSTREQFVLTQLAGSSSSREGRLEVLNNTIWGSVCSDLFTDTDARVACYGLGYGYIGKYIGNRYGSKGYSAWMNGLQCTGSETSLAQCSRYSYDSPQTCQYDNTVSISCKSDDLTGWEITLIVLGSLTLTAAILAMIYSVCPRCKRKRQVDQPPGPPDGQTNGETAVAYTPAVYDQVIDTGLPGYTDASPPTYDSLDSCSICYVHARADVQLEPCGHRTFCGDCTTRLLVTKSNCPICQRQVTSVVPTNARY